MFVLFGVNRELTRIQQEAEEKIRAAENREHNAQKDRIHMQAEILDLNRQLDNLKVLKRSDQEFNELESKYHGLERKIEFLAEEKYKLEKQVKQLQEIVDEENNKRERKQAYREEDWKGYSQYLHNMSNDPRLYEYLEMLIERSCDRDLMLLALFKELNKKRNFICSDHSKSKHDSALTEAKAKIAFREFIIQFLDLLRNHETYRHLIANRHDLCHHLACF